jgi:hypothetical protein
MGLRGFPLFQGLRRPPLSLFMPAMRLDCSILISPRRTFVQSADTYTQSSGRIAAHAATPRAPGARQALPQAHFTGLGVCSHFHRLSHPKAFRPALITWIVTFGGPPASTSTPSGERLQTKNEHTHHISPEDCGSASHPHSEPLPIVPLALASYASVAAVLIGAHMYALQRFSTWRMFMGHPPFMRVDGHHRRCLLTIHPTLSHPHALRNCPPKHQLLMCTDGTATHSDWMHTDDNPLSQS